MAEGRSNKAIGERLFISEHTVEKQVKSIFATAHHPNLLAVFQRLLRVQVRDDGQHPPMIVRRLRQP